MEDTLKRLLDAESRAEKLVDEAKAERRLTIEKALHHVQVEEKRFNARIPEIHADFLRKAEAHAEQTVGELQRRYRERTEQLREAAANHEEEALNAAINFLIKGGEVS